MCNRNHSVNFHQICTIPIKLLSVKLKDTTLPNLKKKMMKKGALINKIIYYTLDHKVIFHENKQNKQMVCGFISKHMYCTTGVDFKQPFSLNVAQVPFRCIIPSLKSKCSVCVLHNFITVCWISDKNL